MNGNPYTSSWIGATQQYPIYEYANLLDSNQSNFVTITSNILHNEIISTSNILHNEIISTSNILEIHSSNNISIASNNLQTQINATCNLIYKDVDRNTIVRISAQNPQYPLIGNSVEMQFQNVNGNYLTKIIQTGELYVYHPVSVIPVGYPAGWWNVENKLSSIIQEEIGLRFDVVGLQATSGTTAITDTAAAATAVATAGAGVAAAGAATGAAGTAIAGGDWGTVALGAAGGALFTVMGYLSYQAQVSSNLSSNGYSNQAAIVQSNINAAKILLTDNIYNISLAKGFINCNIKTPQYIPKLNSDGLLYQGVELSNIIKNTSNYAYCLNSNTTIYINSNIVYSSNYTSNLNLITSNQIVTSINGINSYIGNYASKKINILLPTSNFQYDTTNLYYYDLDLRNYIPYNTISGFKSRQFRITTLDPNSDFINKRNYTFQGQIINIPQTLTIFHNNSSNYLGQTASYPNDSYNNGIIIGKTYDTNIGTWSLNPQNFNYIRYLTYLAGDIQVTLENICN